MWSYVDFDQLSEYYGKTVEELKEYKFSELEKFQKLMKEEKAAGIQKQNAADPEYARLVRKYFSMYGYLRTWFSDEEIIRACSLHMDTKKLVEEKAVKEGGNVWDSNAEFLKKDNRYMPVIYHGRVLEEREYCRCDIYRVKNQYQGLKHGDVVLELLYQKHPELKEFQFKAYSYSGYSHNDYEVYTKNNIYTPFAALMAGDTEAIKNRNLDYAKSYNAGEYTVSNTRERLETEESKHFFDVVSRIGDPVAA